jgi:hypothetical protein
MYLACHTSLLPLMFVSFRVIVVPLTSGDSNLVVEFDQWDRQRISENGNLSPGSAHGRAGSLETN